MCARLITCRAHDAALAIAVTDGDRLPLEARVVEDLYRRKERVEVDVEDAARRRSRRGQPFGSTTTVTSGAIPGKTFTATL